VYRQSDKSREAREWRVEQMHANNAIEGVEKDDELAELVAQWRDEGLSQDEIAERLVEHVAATSMSVA
jgi:hypothetical protein